MPRQGTAIVFIDGNNLYHNLKKYNSIKPGELDLSKLSKLVCDHFDYEHSCTHYYNSIPNQEDNKEIYWAHMKFLDELRNMPNFHVNTRKLQTHQTTKVLQEKNSYLENLNLCAKCKPLVIENCAKCIGNISKKEKGIDVMIAVDMLDKCVLNSECDACILISGDSDFIPVSELIIKRAKKVLSASIRPGYSNELRNKLPFWKIDEAFLAVNSLKDNVYER